MLGLCSTNERDAVSTDVDTRYRDAALTVDEHVEILLSQMTLAEKAGLFPHTMIAMGPDGELSQGDPVLGIASNEEYVVGRSMSHFNLLGIAPTAGEIARRHNKAQELAASTRLGIPVTISTRRDDRARARGRGSRADGRRRWRSSAAHRPDPVV